MTEPRSLSEQVRQLEDEIARLRAVCGEAYQFAGAVGAPERVLDNLLAASEGDALPHETFLPVSADECDECKKGDASA